MSAVGDEILPTVESIAGTFGIASLASLTRACRESLGARGVVDVAVLGQFKAGKSSFLNSLIGREVLPVDVLPATAVVTRLGPGPRERVLVRRTSGEESEIPLADLADFVTERGNPENAKGVALVEVELPELEAYGGVRFVDTPGLGSAFAHNTAASLEWLPRVGAALVAVSVNHPLGEQDLALLSEVAKHTPEVFLLLTKSDLVTDGQRESVLEFVQWRASQGAGRPIAVLPFSTRPGYEGLREDLAEFLRRDVVGRHEEVAERILQHKLGALVGTCREYLRLARAGAEAAGEARDVLSAALARERTGAGSIEAEIRLVLTDNKTRTRTAAAERFQGEVPRVLVRLQGELKTESRSWRGSLARRASAFEEWLRVALAREMAEHAAVGRVLVHEYLSQGREAVLRSVRAFQDRLAREIERALGVPFEGARFHAELAEPDEPAARVGQVFDTHVDLLWFAIPMAVFHGVFERHFVSRVPWEVEKNFSRLAGQWADAEAVALDALAAQASRFTALELSTIESLIAGAVDRRADLREALAILDRYLPSWDGLDSPEEQT